MQDTYILSVCGWGATRSSLPGWKSQGWDSTGQVRGFGRVKCRLCVSSRRCLVKVSNSTFCLENLGDSIFRFITENDSQNGRNIGYNINIYM